MLFGSYTFLFLFFPIFISTFWAAPIGSRRLILLFYSLIFYMSWSIPFLALLLAITAVTWKFGALLAWPQNISPDPFTPVWHGLSRRKVLVIALIIILLPLLWFKYSFFIVLNISLALNIPLSFTPPALPPGISFYTFIQIAWLVGIYRGLFQPAPLREHTLFSCFFPYVLSGPIVRFPQISSQMDNLGPLSAIHAAPGITLFLMGLAKKVLLADSLAPYADAIFNAAQNNWPLLPLDAWLAALAYTFQLYFDFSGYTDMALGIALVVGIKLPENFNSPYRSTGIIEFWRRWHITLGTWLKDFLYIPLGGNRKGKLRQYINLFLTMLIGGIWHGAGWTYAVWGGMHGFMLAVNHFYRSRTSPSCRASLASRISFTTLTFFLLILTWVIFRSPTLDCALAMYKAMLIPSGEDFGTAYFRSWLSWALLVLCGLICWICPNSRAIIQGEAAFLRWAPVKGWACAMGILCALCLIMIPRQANFLYFQF